MEYNIDNRKCTICDGVYDEDCDDCPARPSIPKFCPKCGYQLIRTNYQELFCSKCGWLGLK